MGFRGELSENTPAPMQPASPSRRFFLRTGLAAGTFALTNTEQFLDQAVRAQRTAKLLWYLYTDPSLGAIASPPNIENITANQPLSVYDTAAMQQTSILTFGDSLARGEVDGGTATAPAEFIIKKMNHFLKTPGAWKWQNEAWNGATTDDVLAQVNDVRIHIPSTNTDVMVSVGGNDTLSFINSPDVATKLDKLLADPHDPELLRMFANGVTTFLADYKNNFAHVVDHIKRLPPTKGIGINRLFVHGVPDMGQAKNIVLPTGKKLPLEGDIRTLATHVSKLMNYTMMDVIIQNSTDFDIAFVDNSQLLPEHFSDMHPNQQGYEYIADQQMKQGIVVLPNGLQKTLYDLAA